MSQEHDHSEMQKAVQTKVLAVLEAEGKDPNFCRKCAMIGMATLQIASLQVALDMAPEDERAEIRVQLEYHQRERLMIPKHGKAMPLV